MWNNNDMLSLIDSDIFNQSYGVQILKCIQVGLLCVQQLPADRPDVSALITMLDVDDVGSLPVPKQPGVTRCKGCSSDGVLQHDPETCSVNPVSLTVLNPR